MGTLFNTFAFQRLVFEGKNGIFILENASNLTHEFLYDIFNNKILLNFFLLKLLYKNSCVKFHAFSRRNGYFFSQKRGAEKRKC